MRIVQIAPFEEPVPPKKYGGTELVVYNIVQEMTRLGPLFMGQSHLSMNDTHILNIPMQIIFQFLIISAKLCLS